MRLVSHESVYYIEMTQLAEEPEVREESLLKETDSSKQI